MAKSLVEKLRGTTAEAQQRETEVRTSLERDQEDRERKDRDAQRQRIARFVGSHLDESVELLTETAKRNAEQGSSSASLVWTIKPGLHSAEPTQELQKFEALGQKVGERFTELGFDVSEVSYQESRTVKIPE